MAPRNPTSCRNAKVGDLVTEPAIRELYRSGFFAVKAHCDDEGAPVEYLCLDCGVRFDALEDVAFTTHALADHAYELPRHRVVARCSCGALEVR